MSHTGKIVTKMWTHLRKFGRLCINQNHRKYCYMIPTHSEYQKLFLSLTSQSFEDPNHILKIELYPNTNDDDPVLQSIFESSSMEEVFAAYESATKLQERTERHSSQSLVTLWDIQKYIFQMSNLYDSRIELDVRRDYIKETMSHPTFEEIVNHVVDNCDQLDDCPLAASLQCLKSFNRSIRDEKCQKLLEELLKRKETLSLPALARLFVCLRKESLYGAFIAHEFMPLLYKYVNEMKTDSDVKHVSTSLRSSFHGFPNSIVHAYRKKLNELHDNNTVQFEAVTLCKIVLMLYDSQFFASRNSDGEDVSDVSISLIRNYSKKLIPLVDQLGVMDVLSLSRFVEFQHEPNDIIELISQRILYHFERFPCIDLMACVTPKTKDQRLKMDNYINDFIDNCSYFPNVVQFVYRVLKRDVGNNKTADKFWSKIVQVMTTMPSALISPNFTSNMEINDDEVFTDFDTEDPKASRHIKLIVLKYSQQYINFIATRTKSYRHREFEKKVAIKICDFLDDYQQGKVIMAPSEYCKCISFLIATNYRNVKINPLFLKNFRARDLVTISKAVRLSNFNWPVIIRDVNRRCEEISHDMLNPWEYCALARVSIDFQCAFSSPVFVDCFHKTINSNWMSARSYREIVNLVTQTAYNYPPILEKLSKVISEREDEMSLKFVELFSYASYVCAAEGSDAYPVIARILERNLDKMSTVSILHVMMSLAFQGCLEKGLLNKVFSMKFLDRADNEMKTIYAGTQVFSKIQHLFMELNRAVCIEAQTANIPWFHERYGEMLAATTGFKENYLHREVATVLSEVLGGPTNFLRRIYSPYYYYLDFLIQFDNDGRPIVATKYQNKEIANKVAVLIQNPKDYTTNVRQLKGVHQLKKRHLEILGYTVINVDHSIWNSMHMSERLAKHDYLQSCIFGNK